MCMAMDRNTALRILGLADKPNVSDEEIKTKFRTLAYRFHPDTSREDNAEARFKEVAEAYEFLIPPARGNRGETPRTLDQRILGDFYAELGDGQSIALALNALSPVQRILSQDSSNAMTRDLQQKLTNVFGDFRTVQEVFAALTTFNTQKQFQQATEKELQTKRKIILAFEVKGKAVFASLEEALVAEIERKFGTQTQTTQPREEKSPKPPIPTPGVEQTAEVKETEEQRREREQQERSKAEAEAKRLREQRIEVAKAALEAATSKGYSFYDVLTALQEVQTKYLDVIDQACPDLRHDIDTLARWVDQLGRVRMQPHFWGDSSSPEDYFESLWDERIRKRIRTIYHDRMADLYKDDDAMKGRFSDVRDLLRFLRQDIGDRFLYRFSERVNEKQHTITGKELADRFDALYTLFQGDELDWSQFLSSARWAFPDAWDLFITNPSYVSKKTGERVTLAPLNKSGFRVDFSHAVELEFLQKQFFELLRIRLETDRIETPEELFETIRQLESKRNGNIEQNDNPFPQNVSYVLRELMENMKKNPIGPLSRLNGNNRRLFRDMATDQLAPYIAKNFYIRDANYCFHIGVFLQKYATQLEKEKKNWSSL